MESGFLNRKKSSTSAGLASKISNIDGKVIVNKDKPLKSILKCAGLNNKTGSFPLPNDNESGSMAPSGVTTGDKSGSTLVVEVSNTSSNLASSFAACDTNAGGGLGGNSGPNGKILPKALSMQHNDESFVEHAQGTPAIDTSNSKVLESVVTNDRTNSGAKVVIPITVVEDMVKKNSNTLYGYFVDQRLAFHVVEDYAKNVWAKFGFQQVILHGNFFFFQFASQEGLLKVLEGGPWFIRSKPIFLHIWVANSKLEKEVISKVPVWVRFHKVHAVVYSEAGIQLISEQVGRLMRLDEGTHAMCINPWGRYSYARCLMELSAVHDVLEYIEVAIPLPNGKGHYMEYIDVEYEWWPPRCSHCKIFSHEIEACQVLKRKVNLGSEDEDASAKVKVHNMKAGKKVSKSQQGSRLFKPKSTFIYRPVSKPSSNKVTKEDKPNEQPNFIPPLVTINDLSQYANEYGYFKDNINLDELKRDMEQVREAEKVLDLAPNSSNMEGDGNRSAFQFNKVVSNSPNVTLEGGMDNVKPGNNVASSVGDPTKSGSLWEQFNASTSNNKSPLSGSEGSDDEVDEVLMPEGGGFLDDMEDYYDGYDDQVVLPDKMQAFCDQLDIRLNTRHR